jgi:hypothetical protein
MINTRQEKSGLTKMNGRMVEITGEIPAACPEISQPCISCIIEQIPYAVRGIRVRT